MDVRWFNILYVLIGVLGVKAIEWFSKRDDISASAQNHLWQELGTLREKLTNMETEIKSLRQSRHQLIGQFYQSQLQIFMLQSEVNELYEGSGKPPKYPNLSGFSIPPPAGEQPDDPKPPAPKP